MQIDYLNYSLGIIGTILAIVGIVLSLKSIKKKEPAYSIKSNNLISDSVSKLDYLTILYNEQVIENLTISKILFYNRGSETINQQDLQTINPLKISSVTSKILDISIVQSNHPSNNFSLEFKQKEEKISFIISFDYLDVNQGAVIQIVHTGLTSEDLNITGDIKGVQKFTKIQSDKLISHKPITAQTKRVLGATILFAFVFLGLVVFGGNSLNLMAQSTDRLVSSFGSLFIFGGVLSTAAIVIIVIAFIFSAFLELFIPSNRIPKGLEKFTE